MRSSPPFRRGLWVVAVALGCSLPGQATDLAVLRNGFSIRHEKREVRGDVTRLYVTVDKSSYVDVPTLEIEHFEPAPEDAASVARHQVSRRLASGFGIQASAQPKARAVDVNEVVATASGRYRLDPDLVSSVIKAESGFNVRAVSRKGAQGLMQLMPQTASKLGVPNAFDPQANVEGGTRYLRELLEHYNFDLIKALAAYNAGPQRVEQYGGIPPYYETQTYVARIVKDFNKKKIAERNAAQKPQKPSAGNTAVTPRTTRKSSVQANANAPARP